MSMSGPKAEGEEDAVFAEINITPLTDIFLVLLIIFMVTSSVIASSEQRKSGMRVNLPKGVAKELAAEAADLRLSVTSEGKVLLNGSEVGIDTLTKAFNEAHARSEDTQVILEADETTHHGRVVAVMELAKAAGLHRLSIATRRSAR